MTYMNTTQFKEVNDFLCGNNMAVVATISSETNSPQAGLIYYIADDEGHIYFATANDSRKLINIRKHGGVAFVVGHGVKSIELQIEATAREVTDDVQKSDVIGKIALIANNSPKSSGWPPLLTLSMKSGVTCVELTIDRFKYSDFSVHPGTIITGTGQDLLFNYA